MGKGDGSVGEEDGLIVGWDGVEAVPRRPHYPRLWTWRAIPAIARNGPVSETVYFPEGTDPSIGYVDYPFLGGGGTEVLTAK